MLAERIESWFDEATQKGVRQGMQQGRAEGWVEGRVEGRAEGWVEGRVEGRLEGQANILSKQLKLRFGELPPEAVERLSRATQNELDAWGEAILLAPTLSAVFELPRR
jgi:predicted transposase YdaD